MAITWGDYPSRSNTGLSYDLIRFGYEITSDNKLKLYYQTAEAFDANVNYKINNVGNYTTIPGTYLNNGETLNFATIDITESSYTVSGYIPVYNSLSNITIPSITIDTSGHIAMCEVKYIAGHELGVCPETQIVYPGTTITLERMPQVGEKSEYHVYIYNNVNSDKISHSFMAISAYLVHTGWQDPEGNVYDVGVDYLVDSSIILTGIWENSGMVPLDSYYTIPKPKTYDGYNFLRYEDEKGRVYSVGKTYFVSSLEMSLFAIYEEIKEGAEEDTEEEIERENISDLKVQYGLEDDKKVLVLSYKGPISINLDFGKSDSLSYSSVFEWNFLTRLSENTYIFEGDFNKSGTFYHFRLHEDGSDVYTHCCISGKYVSAPILYNTKLVSNIEMLSVSNIENMNVSQFEL